MQEKYISSNELWQFIIHRSLLLHFITYAVSRINIWRLFTWNESNTFTLIYSHFKVHIACNFTFGNMDASALSSPSRACCFFTDICSYEWSHRNHLLKTPIVLIWVNWNRFVAMGDAAAITTAVVDDRQLLLTSCSPSTSATSWRTPAPASAASSTAGALFFLLRFWCVIDQKRLERQRIGENIVPGIYMQIKSWIYFRPL